MWADEYPRPPAVGKAELITKKSIGQSAFHASIPQWADESAVPQVVGKARLVIKKSIGHGGGWSLGVVSWLQQGLPLTQVIDPRSSSVTEPRIDRSGVNGSRESTDCIGSDENGSK